MKEVNFETIGTHISRTRLNRARKAFIRMSLALFLCVVFSVIRGWAQAPDDTETNPPQTPQMQPGQQAQPASQESDQAPTDAESPAQMEPTPADVSQESQTMTATQILGIMQAEPD